MVNNSHEDLSSVKDNCLSTQKKALEIISKIFDKDSFCETQAFMKKSGEGFEMSVTGYGAVDDELVFAYLEDSSRDNGGFTEGNAEKLINIAKLAVSNSAPLIAFFDCKGAKVENGFNIIADYGKAMTQISIAKSVIPTIAVVNGICHGGQAILARTFDIVISNSENAEFGASPLYVTNKNEQADITVKNINEAADTVKKLLKYLIPSFFSCHEPDETLMDDCNRSSQELSNIPMNSDGKELMSVLSDNGEYFILNDDNEDISTGLTLISGIPMGFVLCKGKKITSNGALCACEAVNLFSKMELPILTLVNTDGIDSSAAGVESNISKPLSMLAQSYISSNSIRITAVTGKLFGSVANVLCSKQAGADYVIALENAVIAPMSSEAAVHFESFDEIKNSSDPIKKKEELISSYESKYSAIEAAKCGLVDDIATYDEFRRKLISAFNMITSRF